MAIYKPIPTAVGITLNYHRIVTMNVNVNDSIYVEICSYIDQEKREEEKEVYANRMAYTYEEVTKMLTQAMSAGKDTSDLPQLNWEGYTNSRVVEFPYSETFSVVDAYEWLMEHDEVLAGGTEI